MFCHLKSNNCLPRQYRAINVARTVIQGSFIKTVFFIIQVELGMSRGVRGHGMDHTKRFPRTLAGFGLTGHGGSRFSCFLEILETHFITKYLQIGPRASRLVIGFFLKARAPSQEL